MTEPMDNDMQAGIVTSIQVGRPRQFDGDSAKPWTSGIRKEPVSGPVFVGKTNVAGDQQADLVHHGGPDKAVLAYAERHYAAWQDDLPGLDFTPGAFGENLTIHGLDESFVCVGDSFRVGDCVLQVSQPRQPCWKLSRRWNLPNLASLVQKNGRTGWYYRVLQEASIESSMAIELVERPFPGLTIAWCNGVMHGRPRSSQNDLTLAECPLLADSWRDVLRKRARRRRDPDTNARLFGQSTS